MKKNNIFWISFSDLMTSLFFIMLVLYVLTFIMLKIKEKQLIDMVDDLESKLAVYELVEQNLEPLKKDTLLFRYESEYKRFTLAFDVKFKTNQYQLSSGKIENPSVTLGNIDLVGNRLQSTIDSLVSTKISNPSLQDVSYLLIIAGYASQTGGKYHNYELSYKRAYNLWDYWKNNGIDFEGSRYDGLIDLQIAGNGWGGVGRFPNTSVQDEEKNQRFIIQIIPKITTN